MNFPENKTEIRKLISRYKSAMNKEKKLHGMISDGYGKRFLIFWLYVVLDDTDMSLEYIRWYQAEFPDCGGEPGQTLSWAILLHRAGLPARKKLAEAMLSNWFMLPAILGENVAAPGIWYGSNFQHAEYVEHFPAAFFAGINVQDKEWIKKEYHSSEFGQLRDDYIRLCKRLDSTSIVAERIKILNFIRNLTELIRG